MKLNEQGSSKEIEAISNIYDSGCVWDDEQLTISKGFEDAIIGVSASKPRQVIYDYYKCVEVVMKIPGVYSKGEMDLDKAMEWVDDLTKIDAGDQTPIFIKKI